MTDHVENAQLLDQYLVGRVKPHIYAFTTQTVPNYLKVGDTYRPVSRRLQEWRRRYPNLTHEFEAKAMVNDDVYFRDHSIHHYLEIDGNKRRLLPHERGEEIYYSREFFRETSPSDVENAIADILSHYQQNTGKYTYYSSTYRLSQIHTYDRSEHWTLRPNQQEAVNAFKTAVDAGRTNLLMYAVMRFGKSFTSLSCAKAIDAKTVVVVSAKADVKSEWKKTTEIPGNFAGYVFIDAAILEREPQIIDEVHSKGGTAVVFLTLQDLQGGQIKQKHQSIIGRPLDLLIVDETHFGARAEEYGKILKEAGQPEDVKTLLRKDKEDRETVEEAEEQLKVLSAKIRLHLSGTPYRILMGSEFEKEDIVAFVQFSDIVAEQEAWDAKHLDDDDVNEWDNPYYGFPQMVRFAFNPNESSRRKIEELRRAGVSFAFSALLEPRSIKEDKKGKLHQEFTHENEILDLLRVIDGTKADENLLGFLDYDKIKEGDMCRHMVMVLPYCASCDAMEKLIDDYRDNFRNLANYEIINISGVEGSKRYKDAESVKRAIAECEDRGQKTLTLTVNRMLTGSTVEQWDTMLYLKDTSSPQEYDQAIFRLQNQYVRELYETVGEGEEVRIIKENLKPQTILVDFDPQRLFRMQEQKSLIYNANVEENGNERLGERIREELRISPVITMNHKRISEIQATDILRAVSEYSANRSISDEARDLPPDLGLLENPELLEVIKRQAEIGSRQGLTLEPAEGDGDDIDLPEEDPDGYDTGGGAKGGSERESAPDDTSLQKRLQTYYQRLLFFALLTQDDVASLSEVLAVLDSGDNARIAKNLGITRPTVKLMLKGFDPFKLSALDYKIQNISQLARDESLEPIERARRALAKFTRISDSEVRTPDWVCSDMIEQIPGNDLSDLVERGELILDVASKSAEFAVSFYQKLTRELGLSHDAVRDIIFSIPTSSIAYEFTRRFYEILDLNVENIASSLTSYELIEDSSKSEVAEPELTHRPDLSVVFGKQDGETMKFGAIVGNPPYNQHDGGAQMSARPIYHEFIELSLTAEPQFMSFIIPTRWYSGGKNLGSFRTTMLQDPHIKELHDYLAPEDVFPGTNNRGGICYFLRDLDYDAEQAGGTRVVTHDKGGEQSESVRFLNTFGLGMFIRDSRGVDIVEKVINSRNFVPLSASISPRKPYGIEGNIVDSADFHQAPPGSVESVVCYGKRKQIGYIPISLVKAHHEWIEKWKVFTPYANNIGTELKDDNQNAFVAEPGSVSSETFITIGADLDLTEQTAHNLTVYLKSKFARFLHAKAKISQHGTKATYKFVPLLNASDCEHIDWKTSSEEIDNQLFELFSLSAKEQEHIRKSIRDM